jgi:hypothetical protein
VQRILKDQGLKFVQSVWQPGAEQPVHGPVEDDADHPEEMLPEEPPPAPRPQATPAAIRAQMSREDLRRLQATLFELSECRRLLDAAMQGETTD